VFRANTHAPLLVSAGVAGRLEFSKIKRTKFTRAIRSIDRPTCCSPGGNITQWQSLISRSVRLKYYERREEGRKKKFEELNSGETHRSIDRSSDCERRNAHAPAYIPRAIFDSSRTVSRTTGMRKFKKKEEKTSRGVSCVRI